MRLIGNKWDEVLESEYSKPYFMQTLKKVNEEYQKFTVYPPQHQVFNAFKWTDFDDVKVVIIGQDPYHGFGQAHGLCFSVCPQVPAPPSLVNIFKEIENDLGIKAPNNGYLAPWAKEGVMMLNSVLTVREGQPQSHKNIGWITFTDSVIKILSEKKEHLVFLLWGRNAIDKSALIDKTKHLVLTAPHPSPLSAYNGFFGCKHFSKTNDYLIKHGLKPINWELKNI